MFLKFCKLLENKAIAVEWSSGSRNWLAFILLYTPSRKLSSRCFSSSEPTKNFTLQSKPAPKIFTVSNDYIRLITACSRWCQLFAEIKYSLNVIVSQAGRSPLSWNEFPRKFGSTLDIYFANNKKFLKVLHDSKIFLHISMVHDTFPTLLGIENNHKIWK